MIRQLIGLLILVAVVFEGYAECQAQIVRRIIERRTAAREAVDEAAGRAEAESSEAPSAAGSLRERRAGRLAARQEQETGSTAPRFDQLRQQAAADREGLLENAAPFLVERLNSIPGLGTGVNQATADLTVGAPIPPTERDLAAMEISGLSRMLHEWNGQLAFDLESFTTAESWHRYLLLPEGLVDVGAIQPDGLSRLQARFDKVAQEPKFEQISDLPSFQAMHRVIQRLASEVSGPQLRGPSGSAIQLDSTHEQAEEVLPVPDPVEASAGSRSERSILIRE